MFIYIFFDPFWQCRIHSLQPDWHPMTFGPNKQTNKLTQIFLQKYFRPIMTSSVERRCRGALFNSRQALQSSQTGRLNTDQCRIHSLQPDWHPMTFGPNKQTNKQTNLHKFYFKNIFDPLWQVALRGGVEGLFSTHVKHFNHRKQGD
jgi:hypothetical protein